MVNRAREARAARGLSQAALAAEVGVSRQALVAIEGGRTRGYRRPSGWPARWGAGWTGCSRRTGPSGAAAWS